MAKDVTAKIPIIKREPAVIGGGVITVLTGLLVAAPDLGIPIPQSVAKLLAGGIILLGSIGIRSKVRPV